MERKLWGNMFLSYHKLRGCKMLGATSHSCVVPKDGGHAVQHPPQRPRAGRARSAWPARNAFSARARNVYVAFLLVSRIPYRPPLLIKG